MDDALPMSTGQRPGDATQDPHRAPDWKLAALRQSVAERFAFDEWHGVVQEISGSAGTQQRQNVGMLQTSGELDLTAEALDTDARREIGRQHLEDHGPAQC